MPFLLRDATTLPKTIPYFDLTQNKNQQLMLTPYIEIYEKILNYAYSVRDLACILLTAMHNIVYGNFRSNDRRMSISEAGESFELSGLVCSPPLSEGD